MIVIIQLTVIFKYGLKKAGFAAKVLCDREEWLYIR